MPPSKTDSHQLPSALEQFDQIQTFIGNRHLAVFLDYDGTLTPIVAQPEQAILDEQTRAAVKALSAVCTVSIVSGRGLADVRKLVAIDGIFYAGSHGFEIAGPSGMQLEHEIGTAFLPLLDRIEREIRQTLSQIAGSRVERKRFSVAVHYRNVEPEHETLVKQTVDAVLSRHPTLRVSPGKKVWDIQPGIPWNKGKALLWLLDAIAPDPSSTLPLYIGDDTTDEDAFEVLYDRGIGILVRDEPRITAARWSLNNTHEVRSFLQTLASKGLH